MSLRTSVRAQAHRATSLHGRSISASDRAPSLSTSVKQTRFDCISGAKPGSQPACTLPEQGRFSPSSHLMGLRRFLLFFLRTRTLHSPRVFTRSRDASTQAALLGVPDVNNN